MRSKTAVFRLLFPGRGRRIFPSFAVFAAVLVVLLGGCASSGSGEKKAKAPVPEETPDTAAIEAAAAALLAAETAAQPRVWTFTEISERIWHLAAIKIGHGVIFLDRAAMKAAGQGEVYVLQFKEEGINGKAVFNYYFAPYARREGNDLTFRQIVGTRQGSPAVVNVAGLGEEEYYWYLQRVTRWEVTNERLVLHAPTGESEIVLYFTLT